MERTGHVGAALLLYGPVGFVAGALAGAEVAVLGGAVAVGLASVPDVDVRVPFVEHRGPTHTAWFAALVGVAVGVAGFAVGLDAGFLSALALGLFGLVTATLSMGSHLAADALTPMGIRPFEPWSDRRYSVDLVRAANPIANYVLLGVGSAVGGGLSLLGVWVHQAV